MFQEQPADTSFLIEAEYKTKAAAGFEPANNGFANRRLDSVSSCKNTNLRKAETSAYKPAYKENTKIGENQDNSMPLDLAEIVQVWPGLPEHIKAAIKTLVDVHKMKK